MQVLPSAYFPSLAYVRALLQDPQLVLDYKEHFVKQSIRTRAEILSANGVIQLNVPILHTAHKQTLEALQIDYSKNWQAEHWRAIESAYANSPHFEHYAHDISQLFDAQYVYLHELNSAILKWINNALDLQLQIELSLDYTGQTPSEKKAWLGRNMNATNAYQQVFKGKNEFVQNLSVIDGLMNEGPLLRTRFVPR
jgi:hypothetical protein